MSNPAGTKENMSKYCKSLIRVQEGQELNVCSRSSTAQQKDGFVNTIARQEESVIKAQHKLAIVIWVSPNVGLV